MIKVNFDHQCINAENLVTSEPRSMFHIYCKISSSSVVVNAIQIARAPERMRSRAPFIHLSFSPFPLGQTIHNTPCGYITCLTHPPSRQEYTIFIHIGPPNQPGFLSLRAATLEAEFVSYRQTCVCLRLLAPSSYTYDNACTRMFLARPDQSVTLN